MSGSSNMATVSQSRAQAPLDPVTRWLRTHCGIALENECRMLARSKPASASQIVAHARRLASVWARSRSRAKPARSTPKNCTSGQSGICGQILHLQHSGRLLQITPARSPWRCPGRRRCTWRRGRSGRRGAGAPRWRSATRRAPDMPSGWPSAIAPPFGLTCGASSGRPSSRRTAQGLGGEGLVDLDRRPCRRS